MKPIEMQSMLASMRSLQADASAAVARRDADLGALDGAGRSEGPDFATLLREGIEQVNRLQGEAKSLASAFESGAPGVGLTEVMVASQKAGIAFEAVKQVRNQVVRAYQDVMSMPM